jgi:uncharacterized protein
LIVYFDTSALLPIVIEEPTSATASRLWDDADRVVSSRLVYVEGRAALAMARRMDRLDDRQLRMAVEGFEAVHEQLDIIEVTRDLVVKAGGLAHRYGLRGYDAVHLASARLLDDPELVLASGDLALVRAAAAVGMSTADMAASE